MSKRPSLADSMRKLGQAARFATHPGMPAHDPAAEAGAVETASVPSAPKRYYAATRAGRRKVTAALEPEVHKQLKLLAVERSRTVEDLLREALSDLFWKHGRPPIA